MTPQESRELFENEIAGVLGNCITGSDVTREMVESKHEIMSALDTYTTSLITHAMQQIEARKRLTGFEADNSDAGYAFNRAKDEDITILQSLLPEQKK